MAERPGNEAELDRDEVADYVAELTSELAKIARRHGLDTLGYLLDMARLEAENTAHGPNAGGGKSKMVHG